MKHLLFVITMAVLLVGCKSPLSGIRVYEEQAGDFINVATRDVNARSIGMDQFLAMTGTSRYLLQRHSYIQFNAAIKQVIFHTTQGYYGGTAANEIHAVFKYEMLPAGDDLVYLRLKNRYEAMVTINGVPLEPWRVSELSLMIALTGFGKYRVEISPVMLGYSALPSGTYWKQQESE